MSDYIITFTPEEPYFLGNERTFSFGDNKDKQQRSGKYHIESDKIPSQTTLLGTLRYLLLGDIR
ncbi:MAG: hypothetical protein RR961_10055, partial [Eubacterium sp.]